MSGYYDAGNEGDGLSPADRGTLNFYDAARAASQQAAQAVQQAQPPEQDTNDYTPYGTGAAQQDYGDQYGAGPGLANAGQFGLALGSPEVEDTTDYSSGVEDQSAGYGYTYPPRPDFSSGVTDEWGGNDPGQATPLPSFSSGVGPTFRFDPSAELDPSQVEDRRGQGHVPPHPEIDDPRPGLPKPRPGPQPRPLPFASFSSGVGADEAGYAYTYAPGYTDEWGGNDPGQAAPPPPDTRERHDQDPRFRYGETPRYMATGANYDADTGSDRINDRVFSGGFETAIDPLRSYTAPDGKVYQWDPNARWGQLPDTLDFENPALAPYKDRATYDAYLQEQRNYRYTQLVQPEVDATLWAGIQGQRADQAGINNYWGQKVAQQEADQKQAQWSGYVDDLQRTRGQIGISPQLEAEQARQRSDYYNQSQIQQAENRDAPGLWAQDRENYGTAVAREQTRFERLADEFTDRNRNGGLGDWVKQQGLTTRELDLVGLLAAARANGNDDQFNAALTQWLAMHDLDPRTMTGTLDREAPGFARTAGAAYEGVGAAIGTGINAAGRVADVGLEGLTRVLEGSNPILATGIRQLGTETRNSLGVDGSQGNVGPTALAGYGIAARTVSDAQLVLIADSAWGRAYGMTYDGTLGDYGSNPLVAAEQLRKDHPDWAFWSDQVAQFVLDYVTGKFGHALADLPPATQAAALAEARTEALKQLPPPRSGAPIAADGIFPPGWSPTKEAVDGVPGPSRNLPGDVGLPAGVGDLPAPVAAAEPRGAVGGRGGLLGGDPGAGVPEPVVAARPPSAIELPAPAAGVAAPEVPASSPTAPLPNAAPNRVSPIPDTPQASTAVETAIAEVKRKIESGAMTTVPSAPSKYWDRFGIPDGGEAIARLVDEGYVKPDQRGTLTALPPERRAPVAPTARPTSGGEWADTLIASPDRTRALKAVNELVQASYPQNAAFAMEKTIGVRTLSTSLPDQQLRDYAEYLAARIRQPAQAQALEGLRSTNPNLYRALKELPPTTNAEVGQLLRQVQSTHIPKATVPEVASIPPTPVVAASRTPRAVKPAESVEAMRVRLTDARRTEEALLGSPRDKFFARDYKKVRKEISDLTEKVTSAEAAQPAGSTVLYSLGPEFGKFAVNEVVGGGVGGVIGYALPAKDDDERWQHAAIGAKFGLGIAAIKYMSPTLSKEATKMLYPNSLGDRGIAETLWQGTAKDLPGLGIARRKAPIFGILRNGQREIVGDRVGAALYHALDSELAGRKVVNLAASADKRIAAQVLKDLIDNPSGHDLTGVFEGTLGEQLKTFLKNHADELRDARTKILSDPVPNGGILTPAEIGRRYSDTVAEMLADQKTKTGTIKGEIGNTKSDPLLRAQQSVVRELAQVWMTLNPRFHINNALSNLSAEIGDIFSDPTLVKDAGVLPGVRGRRAINQADIGTGNRYTRYIADDLTGNVPLGGKTSLINKVGDKIGKGLGAVAPGLETRARKLAGTPERLANVVEKSFKERRYDSNRVGYLSSRMRFEFGQQGLGIEGLGTLFSDHFNNLKPTLTGLPQEVGEKLRGVVNTNGATRILDDFVNSNTITQVQRNQALKTFRTALYDAERFADDKTAWAMRRYNIRSQGDWLLDHIAPLHFWTTHNILATGRLAAKNPVLLAPLAAGLTYWADQNKDLPDNLKWTIELPYKAVLDFAVEHGIDPKIRQDVIDQVDSVYGENADLRLRPFNWLNPVVGGAVQQMSPKENTGQQAAMTMPQHLQQFMEAMGYNPSPVWDLVGGVLRRVPEAAGFKPIDVAGLNEKPYFGNSLLGTWGQWLRAGEEHMANWADANLGSDNVIRGAADLIREVPYKFNEVTYGARYTDYEHEAIARLIANRERLGQITHPQALAALRDGEKSPLFLSARQEFYDDGGKKGLVSWLGAPVSALNDYQRQRNDINSKYFDPASTKQDKQALVNQSKWITTDWSKKDTPEQVAQQVALDDLYSRYQAAKDKGDKKGAAAIYAEIQQANAAPAASASPSASPSAKPSAAPSASAKPNAPLPATVGKGAVTGLRAADVSNEYNTPENATRSQALWDQYNALREADLAEKDKTGKNPGNAQKFFAANAADFNALDTHRTLKPTTTTGAAATTGTATTAPATMGGGLVAGLRAADVSNEYRTPEDKTAWDKLWAEYDRLKAEDQTAKDKTGKSPGNAPKFFEANAAAFNRLDVGRTLKPSGGITSGAATLATTTAPKATSTASTASAPKTPTTGASTTTARSSATSSAPRAVTTSAPRASTATTRSSTTSSSTTRTAQPTTSAKATYSSGLAAQTEAQKSARPFLSGGQAKAQGLLDPKQFATELTAYTKGDLGGYDRAVALLDTFGKAGGNVTPYAQQILRTNMTTIATVIKAYKGTDRDQGQLKRAEWLRRMGAITPDLAGLKALRALWREVLPPQQKAA